MRRRTALLGALTAAAVSVAGGLAAPAPALVTGISDQHPAFMTDARFRALNVQHVRLVVPWDAGLRNGPWDAWLALAASEGLQPLVAFNHAQDSACPGTPCPAPSTDQLAASVRGLLAKHPAVRDFIAWNEPNHRLQPTYLRPSLAAAYYDAVQAACPSCDVAAGDLLDDASLVSYLSAYRAAMATVPRIWSMHNYGDATYRSVVGTDRMLGNTTGELWLGETGGMVSFRTASGIGDLPYDEARAARSVTWLYKLAAARPRVTRMYLYQWQGSPDNAFDSGLIGYNGLPRPAFAIFAAQVGPRLAPLPVPPILATPPPVATPDPGPGPEDPGTDPDDPEADDAGPASPGATVAPTTKATAKGSPSRGIITVKAGGKPLSAAEAVSFAGTVTGTLVGAGPGTGANRASAASVSFGTPGGSFSVCAVGPTVRLVVRDDGRARVTATVGCLAGGYAKRQVTGDVRFSLAGVRRVVRFSLSSGRTRFFQVRAPARLVRRANTEAGAEIGIRVCRAGGRCSAPAQIRLRRTPAA